MKAEDLRIHNILSARYSSPMGDIVKWSPVIVDSINNYMKTINTNAGETIEINKKLLKPETLTEEWLLRLGAKPAIRSPYIDKRAWQWGKDMEAIVWCSNRLFKYASATELICISDWSYEIDSVHRLQNAFAGIGIELTTLV